MIDGWKSIYRGVFPTLFDMKNTKITNPELIDEILSYIDALLERIPQDYQEDYVIELMERYDIKPTPSLVELFR